MSRAWDAKAAWRPLRHGPPVGGCMGLGAAELQGRLRPWLTQGTATCCRAELDKGFAAVPGG